MNAVIYSQAVAQNRRNWLTTSGPLFSVFTYLGYMSRLNLPIFRPVMFCRIIVLPIISLLFLTSGCFSIPKTTQDVALGGRFTTSAIPPGKCRLVVCWPSDEYKVSTVQPVVTVAGKEVGILKPLGYLEEIVDPGETLVQLKCEEPVALDHKYEFKVTATKDTELYVFYDPYPVTELLGWRVKMTLKLPTLADGRAAALKTRRSNN